MLTPFSHMPKFVLPEREKKPKLFVRHRFFCIIIRNADGKFKLGNG